MLLDAAGKRENKKPHWVEIVTLAMHTTIRSPSVSPFTNMV